MSGKIIRESFSLKTDDIPGAKPMLKSYLYTNKVSYSNSTQGIEKSFPQNLKFSTGRVINPLSPEYKLPTPKLDLITPPKFIRDAMDVKDINVPKSKVVRSLVRSSLDVSDIVCKLDSSTEKNLGKYRKRRNTNPLCPEYLVIAEDSSFTVIGEVTGSKPKNLVNTARPAHNRTLDVKDIQGKKLINSCTLESFYTPKIKLTPKNCFKVGLAKGKSADLKPVPISLKTSASGSISGLKDLKTDRKKVVRTKK